MPKGELTPKQQRFVDEYLIDPNATKAAVRAGYSAKTAGQGGAQLLKNSKVFAAIKARQAKIGGKLEVTAERIKAELALLGFANMLDYTRVNTNGDLVGDLSALSRDQAAALSEVTIETYLDGGGEDAQEVKRVKFKLHDKRAALVDLGKHLGMFKDEGGKGGDIHIHFDAADRELF